VKREQKCRTPEFLVWLNYNEATNRTPMDRPPPYPSPGYSYGFLSRELSSILLQPSNKSIHINVGSDNHMVNFVGNELLGWLTKDNEDWSKIHQKHFTALTYIHKCFITLQSNGNAKVVPVHAKRGIAPLILNLGNTLR